jgi:hypothetical protein
MDRHLQRSLVALSQRILDTAEGDMLRLTKALLIEIQEEFRGLLEKGAVSFRAVREIL